MLSNILVAFASDIHFLGNGLEREVLAGEDRNSVRVMPYVVASSRGESSLVPV